MVKRIRRNSINKIDAIESVEGENNLTMITPDTNPTEIPYQGVESNHLFYMRQQAGCFELDSAINEIIQKRFTGNNLRNMSDEDAIAAYSAMETAKANRTRQFIELTKQLADDNMYRKLLEMERLKTYGSNKIIDCQTVQENGTETDGVENKETIKEIDREKRQHVMRLLQEACLARLEKNENIDNNNID